MKKRILLIGFTFALVLALTGCGDDPLELFNKANANLSKAKSADAAVDFKASVGMSGISTDVSGDANLKIAKNENFDVPIDAIADFSFSAMTVNVNGKAYLTDSYLYLDVAGDKSKMKLEKSDWDEIVKASQGEESTALTEDMVKEKSIEKADGGQKVHLVIDSEKYLVAVNETLKDSGMEALDLSEAKMSDVTIDAVIDKNDAFKSFAIKCEVSVEESGETTTAKVDVTFTFDSIDQELTFDFPDLKSFKATM